jgi:hypothetical protein
MTYLYSLYNQRPAPLPFRIRLNGTTRTDPSTFTAEEIQASGLTGPYSEPPYDPATEQLLWRNGEYVIEALPPMPKWVEFSAAIMAMPAVNVMLGAVLQTAPGLYGGMVVGLQQASEGDSRVFINSWSAAKKMGLITVDLIELMQGLGVKYGLPQDFITVMGDVETTLTSAHDADGTLMGDDPFTPDVNEA